jgi:hypothetical protein
MFYTQTAILLPYIFSRELLYILLLSYGNVLHIMLSHVEAVTQNMAPVSMCMLTNDVVHVFTCT